MSSCLIDLQYFPPISYFKEINKFNTVVLNDQENFQKQTYRNRCSILGANGKLNLSIPMNHGSERSMQKIELSYIERWYSIHIKSIESAYRKSPFYDYYADELLACINAQHLTLWDLNYDILSTLIDLISLDVVLEKKSEFKKNIEINLTNKIRPKKPEIIHQTTEYQQVFGDNFTQNLSIIDLIFCTGPEAIMYLQ